MASAESTTEFIEACKLQLMRLESFSSQPIKFKNELQVYEAFIKENWPIVFNNLNETPLTEHQTGELNSIIEKIKSLEKTAVVRSSWFQGFQDFIQKSLKK
jgi:hypothetical protein